VRSPSLSLVLHHILLLYVLFLSGTAMADSTPAPSLSARSWLVVDVRSGIELAAHDADRRLPPASLTKLMTAYVIFGELRAGRLRLDDRATVSRYAARLPGARMFLTAGESVQIEDLLKGMLVQSGNDATFTLVERVAGNLPAFVERMNTEAARLGLINTHFANATGLQNPAHYSSARDLARLARALRHDFPEYLDWFRLREFSWAGITQPNRNRLLTQMPEVDGLKTGHTEAAGYCLAVSAAREAMQLVAVVLGSESEAARAHHGRTLIEYGFRAFETRPLLRAGVAVARVPVWLGSDDEVALGSADDRWLTLPRGDFERLQIRTLLPESVQAPVPLQAAIGQLQWWIDEARRQEIPLISLHAVSEGSLAKRTSDRLRYWWHHGVQAQAAPSPVTLDHGLR
jgi:D-alanyl-D-alanine carboxypeptidase (penicillin-binding protein 5/6)